eukprot:366212-Chlamydomonas_euryale.AAC.5
MYWHAACFRKERFVSYAWKHDGANQCNKASPHKGQRRGVPAMLQRLLHQVVCDLVRRCAFMLRACSWLLHSRACKQCHGQFFGASVLRQCLKRGSALNASIHKQHAQVSYLHSPSDGMRLRYTCRLRNTTKVSKYTNERVGTAGTPTGLPAWQQKR